MRSKVKLKMIRISRELNYMGARFQNLTLYTNMVKITCELTKATSYLTCTEAKKKKVKGDCCLKMNNKDMEGKINVSISILKC